MPCSSQEVAVTSQDAGTKRGSPREEIWSWAESHESDLGSQAGGRADARGMRGRGQEGLHRAEGLWCSHTWNARSGRDVTSESRCVPGWEQGAPGVDLRTLNHEGAVPRRMMSSEVLSQEGR